MSYLYHNMVATTEAEIVGTDTDPRATYYKKDAEHYARTEVRTSLLTEIVRVGRFWQVRVDGKYWLNTHGGLTEIAGPEAASDEVRMRLNALTNDELRQLVLHDQFAQDPRTAPWYRKVVHLYDDQGFRLRDALRASIRIISTQRLGVDRAEVLR